MARGIRGRRTVAADSLEDLPLLSRGSAVTATSYLTEVIATIKAAMQKYPLQELLKQLELALEQPAGSLPRASAIRQCLTFIPPTSDPGVRADLDYLTYSNAVARALFLSGAEAKAELTAQLGSSHARKDANQP